MVVILSAAKNLPMHNDLHEIEILHLGLRPFVQDDIEKNASHS